MVGLLSALEPRHEHPEVIIFEENDEVNEVIFFHRGCLDLGFEINRFKHFVLRIKDDLLLGAYNLSYNKRTRYIYKTNTMCTGFFIRRENWWNILGDEEHKVISTSLVEQCKRYYFVNIHSKMRIEKELAIKKWRSRSDYEAMISMKDFTHIQIKAADMTARIEDETIFETEVGDEIRQFEALVTISQERNEMIFSHWDRLYQKYCMLEKKYNENLVKIENLNVENDILLGLRSSIKSDQIDCSEKNSKVIIIK
jgi:hypothetical protein